MIDPKRLLQRSAPDTTRLLHKINDVNRDFWTNHTHGGGGRAYTRPLPLGRSGGVWAVGSSSPTVSGGVPVQALPPTDTWVPDSAAAAQYGFHSGDFRLDVPAVPPTTDPPKPTAAAIPANAFRRQHQKIGLFTLE